MNDPQFSRPLLDIRAFFRERSSLSVLILINIVVWGLIQLVRVALFLSNRGTAAADTDLVISYLAVPASLATLAARPWTLFTYMFLHVSVWHILFNMLWLYWFGKIFLGYLSQRTLVWVYLLGGITGGLVYICAFNIFPVFGELLPVSMALGASASVMAIVTAVAFYVPNYTMYLLFIGRIRIVWLAIGLFVIDFFMIPTGNAGGHLAHIGGALFGFVYIRLVYPAVRSRFSQGKPSFFDFISKMTRKKKKGDTDPFSSRPLSDDEYNAHRVEKQKRIDQILEKISRGGYESLTREEKEFLFKSSNKS
jgi:membrane associated rhomboid family serine protease